MNSEFSALYEDIDALGPEISDDQSDKSLSGEFKALIERISLLENKLNKNFAKRPKKRKGHKKKSSKSKDGNKNENTDFEMRGNENLDQHVTDRHDGERRSPRGEIDGDKKLFQQVRPTSAPQPSKRAFRNMRLLAPTENNKNYAAPVIETLQPETQSKPKGESIYTYDLLSGRKLLKAKMEEIERMRYENALKLDNQNKRDEEALLNSSTVQAMPTKSEYPGPGTKRSVSQWLQRMRQLKESQPKDTTSSAYLQPRFYNSYKKMQNLDMVISVEHCFNCEYHTTSLRHDPEEYVISADTLLRHLAQVAHQFKPCVRLGVVRFRANITPKSKQSDVDSRIGAFEVQIAYRNHIGQLSLDVLHSKLYTRLWPSKTSVEKRLLSFFNRVGVQAYQLPLTARSISYDDVGHDGLDNYPVGMGPWTETLLSSPTWTFPGVRRNTSVMLSGSLCQPVRSDDKASDVDSIELLKTSIPNVQWVFDSKSFFSIPKFEIGQLVSVAHYICFYFLNTYS